MMDRAELVVLHAALETVLAWPDSVRDQVAAWLASGAAQPGNGLDLHPAPIAATGKGAETVSFPPPRQAKARRRPNAFTTQTIERKLLGALRDNPDLSERAAANAAGVSRATAAERLRALADRGAIEKGAGGRWRLKGEEKAGQPAQGAEADPPPAPSN
jgi:hypothetical protein